MPSAGHWIISVLLPVHTLVLDSLARVLNPLAALARIQASLARVLALIGILASCVWQVWVSPSGRDRVGFDAKAGSPLALSPTLQLLWTRYQLLSGWRLNHLIVGIKAGVASKCETGR